MKREDKIALERYKQKLDFARTSHVNPYETMAKQKDAIARAKSSFKYCVKRYFPHFATSEVPDFHIDAANKVKRKKTIKAILRWGRAHAKSVLACILLPFWLWLNGEPVYLVLVGNNQERAKQLLEDIQAEFEANPQIIRDFGEQYNLGSWEAGFFITKGGFIGQALGMGQSVRGLRVKNKRPTLIVMDDCETKDLVQNPQRQTKMAKWVERDLIPTMDGEYRRFVMANNRFAPVMIQTMLQERHPDWLIHEVNAYDPVTYQATWADKYTPEYWQELENEIGILAAHAEYNNKPHVEGAIFKQENVQWGKVPKLDGFNILIGFWDVAYAGTATSDYNAVILQGLHGSNYWVLDCFCKQSKMYSALAYMCAITKEYVKKAPTVTIHWRYEAQFWNDEVDRTITEVQNAYGIRLNIAKWDGPKTKKYDRILRLHPYYQNGRIYYSDKLKSHNDTQTGIAQLLGIEPGYKTHDDWPDAHQQGIALLEPYNGQGKGSGNFKHGKMKPKNARI